MARNLPVQNKTGVSMTQETEVTFENVDELIHICCYMEDDSAYPYGDLCGKTGRNRSTGHTWYDERIVLECWLCDKHEAMRLEKAKKDSIHRCEVCGEQADVWFTGRSKLCAMHYRLSERV